MTSGQDFSTQQRVFEVFGSNFGEFFRNVVSNFASFFGHLVQQKGNVDDFGWLKITFPNADDLPELSYHMTASAL